MPINPGAMQSSLVWIAAALAEKHLGKQRGCFGSLAGRGYLALRPGANSGRKQGLGGMPWRDMPPSRSAARLDRPRDAGDRHSGCIRRRRLRDRSGCRRGRHDGRQEGGYPIDGWLNGKNLRAGRELEGPFGTQFAIDTAGWQTQRQVPVPAIELARRATSFDEVHTGYTEEQAPAEARRCLSCGIRPIAKDVPTRARLAPSILARWNSTAR